MQPHERCCFFSPTPLAAEPILPSLSILSVVTYAELARALPALVCGGLGLAMLVRGRGRLAGTTLLAAWWWALLSLSLLTLTSAGLPLWVDDPQGKAQRAMYFAAAMTSFCPLMALLGAKRPQHRAWQWIVVALWLVLALPSVEWLLFHRGGGIHAARSWFLVILIAIGTINYLPTRFWLASLLYGAAEVALVARFLPGGAGLTPLPAHLPLALIAAALAAATWLSGRPARDTEPLLRLWRDFCNLFGTVWALRVAERLSALAAHDHREFRWTWAGLHLPNSGQSGSIPEEIRPWLAKNLRSLVLPFVSSQWIAQRLEGPAAQAQGAENARRENPV